MTPNASFNLWTEPWIPVLNEHGQPEELGLRDLFARAPQLREIRDPMPILEFGVYRLLVTILLDIFRPSGLADIEDLLQKGAFDQDAINKYFSDYNLFFDLFHPTRPFYQVPGMKDEKPKPLAGLLPPIASGTNAIHFHHAPEEAFRVCPAAAALLLCSVPPFMTAGGAGLSPSINGAPPWYVLILGNNLFETLLYNCPVLEPHYDLPAWRREKAIGKNEEIVKTGLLGAFTWQPRRIQLIPNEGGICSLTGRTSPILIGQMKFSAGAKARVTTWQDPSVPYRITDKGIFPLRPQEEREVWRDTGPIALLNEKDIHTDEKKIIRYERPAIISQYAKLQTDYLYNPDAELALNLYGLCTDGKMKMYEWYREKLNVPVRLSVRGRLTEQCRIEMDTAENVAYQIRRGLKLAYPRDGKGNNKANQTLIERAHREFWSLLRSPYDRLLHDLARIPDNAPDSELTGAAIPWRQVVRFAASRVFNKAIGDLDTNAEAIERSVRAERIFFSGLNKLIPTGGEL